ncbi:MAG: helix-turn-helix domain-containing protein [Mycetocola sp.]
MTPTEPDTAALGARVRELRALRQLTMRDLADRAGVSAGYISQIEKGQANASLQVVRSIADAFGMQWMELFQPAPVHGRVLRRSERSTLFSSTAVRHYGITQPPLGNVEVIVSEYEPGEQVGDDSYTHGDSQEVCVVLAGTIRFTIADSSYELSAGDSIEIRTSTPHSLINIGSVVAEAIWVVTPPSAPVWP